MYKEDHDDLREDITCKYDILGVQRYELISILGLLLGLGSSTPYCLGLPEANLICLEGVLWHHNGLLRGRSILDIYQLIWKLCQETGLVRHHYFDGLSLYYTGANGPIMLSKTIRVEGISINPFVYLDGRPKTSCR